MLKSFGCQFFFPLCGSLASAVLLVSGSGTCTPKSLSASGRFLCPVVVRVGLKSLSSSGLSSAEMAPLAIPIEKATPQSGAPNSSQCSNGQCTIGRHDRTCVRCARSCTIHVQTDIYIYIYIYIYKQISRNLD